MTHAYADSSDEEYLRRGLLLVETRLNSRLYQLEYDPEIGTRLELRQGFERCQKSLLGRHKRYCYSFLCMYLCRNT